MGLVGFEIIAKNPEKNACLKKSGTESGTVEGLTYYPQFMFYFMQTECFQGHIRVNGTGATFLGISQESIGNFKICLPSLPEQVAIVEYLDQTTLAIDITIARATREIELLKEYQTRLISDVVTGKLDVREVSANLADTPDKTFSYVESSHALDNIELRLIPDERMGAEE